MATKIHTVRKGKLYRPDGSVVCQVGPKTGWVDWLKDARHKSFRYESPRGHCTVVKEKKVTPTDEEYFYWRAHRRIGGRLRRKTLGKAEKVTLYLLEIAAVNLAQLDFEDAVSEPKRGIIGEQRR